MNLTKADIDGLNVALNEARILGAEVDLQNRVAAITFSVLTLPEVGPMPEDNRVQFLLHHLGRFAASLRNGEWNDDTATVEKFEISELLGIVEGFKTEIYGWEFFDVDETKDFARWANRLSLDCSVGTDGISHSLDLFQGDGKRHLDMRFWFDDFIIRDPLGKEISLTDFIAGGKRWWDGLYGGDERTKNMGIIPFK